MFKEVLESIERGRSGLNRGLPMGFKRLTKFINGVQPGRYDLIFGREGTGKTALVDNCYVLNPYNYLKTNESHYKLHVTYFSMEIAKREKITKWIAMKIFMDTGIICSPADILSKGEHRCSDELYQLVCKTSDYFEELQDTVTILDIPQNPTGMYKYINKFALENGKILVKDEYNKIYVPNDPNLIHIIVVDTLGNIPMEDIGGVRSMKTTIDKASEYARGWRNFYHYSPVMVAHANRAIGNMHRAKLSEIYPTLEDIKDTNQPSQDANTVLCVFDPVTYMNENNDLHNFGGYKINRLRGRFKSVGILKNREGENNVRIGLNFLGENGKFRELPEADKMTDADYQKALLFA